MDTEIKESKNQIDDLENIKTILSFISDEWVDISLAIKELIM